jgi:hypothetical protein
MELNVTENELESIEESKIKENIVKLLNTKLYEDPEFFGDFGQENVIDVVIQDE